MYRCNNCGAIFDEPNITAVEEGRGEYWGIPCSETVYYDVCPKCGSYDYVAGTFYSVEIDYQLCDPYTGDVMSKSRHEEFEVFAEDEDYVEDEAVERLYDKYGEDIEISAIVIEEA